MFVQRRGQFQAWPCRRRSDRPSPHAGGGRPLGSVAPTTVRPVLSKFSLETTVALDSGCATFRAYQAWGLPRVALIGADGRVKSVVAPEALTVDVIRKALAGEALDLSQIPPWPDPQGAEEFMCGTAAR